MKWLNTLKRPKNGLVVSLVCNMSVLRPLVWSACVISRLQQHVLLIFPALAHGSAADRSAADRKQCFPDWVGLVCLIGRASHEKSGLV